MDKNHTEQAKIFKAFCDENRLIILEMLKNGELCACHLLEDLSISQSTLSHHMAVLCEAEIVSARKDGKWTYYSIDTEGSKMAAKLLKQITNRNRHYPADACD